MCEYKDFITAPEYLKTIADTIGSVACQAARTASFLDLYQAFEDAGLAPIVMKGILCRVLYGKYQDHRPSSDEDILIRQEDFPLLCQVMASKGFTAENDTVTPQMLETLQEITFYDRQGGLHIEVHTNPMGHNTYVHQKMNTYFKDVFSKKFCVTIDGTKIWTMRPNRSSAVSYSSRTETFDEQRFRHPAGFGYLPFYSKNTVPTLTGTI